MDICGGDTALDEAFRREFGPDNETTFQSIQRSYRGFTNRLYNNVRKTYEDSDVTSRVDSSVFDVRLFKLRTPSNVQLACCFCENKLVPALAKSRRIVVFLHTNQSNLLQGLEVLPVCAELGASLLAYDLRGSGKSEGTGLNSIDTHLADLNVVLSWARTRARGHSVSSASLSSLSVSAPALASGSGSGSGSGSTPSPPVTPLSGSAAAAAASAGAAGTAATVAVAAAAAAERPPVELVLWARGMSTAVAVYHVAASGSASASGRCSPHSHSPHTHSPSQAQAHTHTRQPQAPASPATAADPAAAAAAGAAGPVLVVLDSPFTSIEQMTSDGFARLRSLGLGLPLPDSLLALGAGLVRSHLQSKLGGWDPYSVRPADLAEDCGLPACVLVAAEDDYTPAEQGLELAARWAGPVQAKQFSGSHFGLRGPEALGWVASWIRPFLFATPGQAGGGAGGE